MWIPALEQVHLSDTDPVRTRDIILTAFCIRQVEAPLRRTAQGGGQEILSIMHITQAEKKYPMTGQHEEVVGEKSF